MKLIKGLLLLVLLLTIGVVGVFAGVNRGLIPESTITQSPLNQLSSKVPMLASLLPKTDTSTINQNVTGATQNVASQAANMSSQFGAILGSTIHNGEPLSNFIQVNSNATNSAQGIAGQSLEYARYLYCQQVVQEWERTH